MAALMEQLVSYFVLMAIGFILVKFGILKSSDSNVLSKITVYLILPCTIIQAFQIESTPEKTKGLILAFAVAIGVHIVAIAFISILSKFLHMNGVEKASVIYTNSGNMIIPLITAMFGEEWVLYSSAFIAVQLIFLWTHGKAVICEDRSFNIKKILLNINVIAIAIGIILYATGIQLPNVVHTVMSSASAMLMPAGMLVLGMLFTELNWKEIFTDKRLYLMTALRMLVLPALILVLITCLHLKDLVSDGRTIMLISFLATLTPVAVTVTQITQVYGKDEKEASALNLMTTIVSIAAIPLFVWLYQLFN